MTQPTIEYYRKIRHDLGRHNDPRAPRSLKRAIYESNIYQTAEPHGTELNVIWAAAGVIGLPAGTILRGQVYRLSVQGGEPDMMCCRQCGALLPASPALRCAGCRTWFGTPLAIELTTAAVIALLLARFGRQPAVAAFAYLAILGVALAQIDTAVRRLPDRLTLPAYPALLVLLAVAAAIGDDGAALARALLGGLALGGGYLILGLASSGQLGGGDIKLAGLIGMVLGWLSWGALITGACLGFLIAAIVSLALLASRRVSLRSTVSFGPYMLCGALLAVLATAPVS